MLYEISVLTRFVKKKLILLLTLFSTPFYFIFDPHGSIDNSLNEMLMVLMSGHTFYRKNLDLHLRTNNEFSSEQKKIVA